jgi:hypothetical protein
MISALGDRQPPSISPPPELRSVMAATLETFADVLLAAIEAKRPSTPHADPHDWLVGVISDRGGPVGLAVSTIRELVGFFPVATIREAVMFALLSHEAGSTPIVAIHQRDGAPVVALMHLAPRSVELAITSPGGAA